MINAKLKVGHHLWEKAPPALLSPMRIWTPSATSTAEAVALLPAAQQEKEKKM